MLIIETRLFFSEGSRCSKPKKSKKIINKNLLRYAFQNSRKDTQVFGTGFWTFHASRPSPKSCTSIGSSTISNTMIRTSRKINQTKDRKVKNKRGGWGPLGPLGSPPLLFLIFLSLVWLFFLDFLIILFDFVDFPIDVHDLGDVLEA